MSNNQKKHASRIKVNEEKLSLLYWILMGFTLLFFFISPYSRGLFLSNRNEFDPALGIGFQGPLYTSLTFIFIALLLTAFFCYFFFYIRQKTDYIILLVWLIPLSYFISVTQGVSVFMSLQGAYLQMMFASLFIIGALLSRNKLGSALLNQGLLLSGYVIVVYGLLVWFGNLNGAGVIINDGTGIRLTSVFTYANTYAGFLLAIILGATYLSSTATKRWIASAHALVLVPAIVSLFLTLSRGGMVLLPVFFLVILLFMRFVDQVKACAILIIAGGAALAVTSLCTNNGIELTQVAFQQSLMLESWAVLIAASIVTALAAVGIGELTRRPLTKLINKVESLRFSNLWLPLAATLVGGLFLYLLLGTSIATLLPESLAGRVENINFNQHSVRERGYFYLDAMKIFKDYPLFGTGSGGWAALYQSHQSYPYVSRQSHNFFVQVLDDVGLFGSLIIFSFIIIILALYIRHSIKHKQVDRHSFPFFILAVSLLGHALIDFDMSYAFISALVYISLGGVFAASRDESLPIKQTSNLNKVKWAYPVFLGVISLVMLVVSYRMYLGNGKAKVVVAAFNSGQVNLPDAQTKLDEALKLHPTNTDYSLLKVNLYNQIYTQNKDTQYIQAGESILQKLQKKEPYLIESYEYRYSWAMEQGQYAAAVENADGSLRQNPWAAIFYERAMSLQYLLGEQARTAADLDTSAAHWNRVLELYQQVLDRQAEIAKVPSSITIGNPLVVTRDIALPLGQVQYGHGSYVEATATLQPFLSDSLDDQVNRSVIRYYLAGLSKQGKSDQAWYDKLVAKDPNEKAAIEKLVDQKS